MSDLLSLLSLPHSRPPPSRSLQTHTYHSTTKPFPRLRCMPTPPWHHTKPRHINPHVFLPFSSPFTILRRTRRVDEQPHAKARKARKHGEHTGPAVPRQQKSSCRRGRCYAEGAQAPRDHGPDYFRCRSHHSLRQPLPKKGANVACVRPSPTSRSRSGRGSLPQAQGQAGQDH